MTNDAFFTALEACKDQFTWAIEETGQIRATHPQHPDHALCPWTALALTRGRLFPLNQDWKAGWYVGRSTYRHTQHLASIADGDYRDDDATAAALRVRLLTCLGLEEKTP